MLLKIIIIQKNFQKILQFLLIFSNILLLVCGLNSAEMIDKVKEKAFNNTNLEEFEAEVI